MDKISLFGKGFVGSRYCELYPGFSQGRNDVVPEHPQILYTISTVHNYNVFDDPHLDINTNLNHLICVLEEARKKFHENVEFNFLSSWFVYGKTPLPAKEDAPCNPKGFYSITKYAAELLLASYCRTFNMTYRILRLANVIGERDKGISLKKNATQYLIREIVKGNPISIYDEPCTRDFIYVDDVCRAISLVMRRGKENEIYNIGNGMGYIVSTLLKYAMNLCKYDESKVTRTHSDFHDIVQTQKMYLDITKLVRLGYSPTVEVADAVEKIVEYYKNGN